MIKIFNENTFKKDLNTGQKMYIYFYSPNCGPCKITSPLIEKFGNTTNNLVYTVDSKEGIDLQKQLEISGYPSMIVIENSKVIRGGIGQGEVEKIIQDGTSNKWKRLRL